MKKIIFFLMFFSCTTQPMYIHTDTRPLTPQEIQERKILAFFSSISFSHNVRFIQDTFAQIQSLHANIHASSANDKTKFEMETDIIQLKKETQEYVHNFVNIIRNYYHNNCPHLSKEKIHELCKDHEAFLLDHKEG